MTKIIHETPNAYGINRASWSLEALSNAYEKTYGERASRSSISEYFTAAGYKFKKAKKSLTSFDPTYREKLSKIKDALSHLLSDEKFFSIENLGPSQSEFMAEGHSSRAIRYERSPRGKEVGAPSFVRQLWSCRRIRFYISIPKRKTPRR